MLIDIDNTKQKNSQKEEPSREKQQTGDNTKPLPRVHTRAGAQHQRAA